MSENHLFNLNGKISYVTGGLGIVGSAVCRALKSCGASTIALDTASAIKRSSPAEFRVLQKTRWQLSLAPPSSNQERCARHL